MDRLAAMEAFVRIVDAGSFSGAAKQLRVGQPAMSKAVQQLEDRLGVRLLTRTTRGLSATEAGLNFYERARRAIDEADEAELAARGAAGNLSGRLRIGAAVTFARLHIVPKLPLFLAEYPGLEVDVTLDDRNIDLIEEGLDVALRMGVLADSTLTARRIAQGQRFVLGTPAYFDAHGTPQSPADLERHWAVIYNQHGGGHEWTFRRDSEEVTATLQGRTRINAAEGVREAVLAGLGLAVASEWMFTPELASGAVVSVLKHWSLPPIDLSAVYPAGRMAATKARAFVRFVEQQLGVEKADNLPTE